MSNILRIGQGGISGTRILSVGDGVQFLGGGAAGEASYDADAETLFAAMSTQPDDTRKTLISDTITSLKSAGIWDELDELWMLAAHAEQAGLLGWKRYRDCLTVNAPTFTADEGFAGNDSTSYLNTQFVPSTDGVQYTLNDCSLGVYSRTDLSIGGADIGASNASLANLTSIAIRTTADTFTGSCNHTGITNRAFTGNVSSLGFFVARRTGSTASQLYKNAVEVATGTGNSQNRPTVSLYIGARNDNGTPADFISRQCAVAFVGAALTPTQQSNLFTIIETHLDAIGAGVVA